MTYRWVSSSAFGSRAKVSQGGCDRNSRHGRTILSGMEVRLDTGLELMLERAPNAHASRVLATVVATAGSTYRKPGARMLLMADGSYIGLLSGGCLESDLQIHAPEVMDSGVARSVGYDTRGPDDTLFGAGAGWEGTMRVLLEPAGTRATLHA